MLKYYFHLCPLEGPRVTLIAILPFPWNCHTGNPQHAFLCLNFLSRLFFLCDLCSSPSIFVWLLFLLFLFYKFLKVASDLFWKEARGDFVHSLTNNASFPPAEGRQLHILPKYGKPVTFSRAEGHRGCMRLFLCPHLSLLQMPSFTYHWFPQEQNSAHLLLALLPPGHFSKGLLSSLSCFWEWLNHPLLIWLPNLEDGADWASLQSC